MGGIDVVPASQTSYLYVGMAETDVYKILGRPSGQIGDYLLLYDLYDPKFSGRTVPHYVLLNRYRNVKHWGSSGNPDKEINLREIGQ